MDAGFSQTASSLAMGLLDVPSAAALWDFLQTGIPSTAEIIADFRFVIVLAGFIVGILVGMTGVGGGTLLTPLLIVLGVRPTIAVGSDLLYGSLTKMAGAVQHWQRDSIHWDWVRYMAMGSVPASLAAVLLLHVVQSRFGSADELVQFSLGAVLLLSTVLILVNEVFGRMRAESPERKPIDPQTNPTKIILIGVGVGFMVGLTSLGSGSVVAVALMAFSRLIPRHIVGTNIAHALMLLSAAAMAHWQLGTVDILLTANLLAGSLPGVVLGSRLAYYTPARPLKFGMALLVLAGALKMIRVW